MAKYHNFTAKRLDTLKTSKAKELFCDSPHLTILIRPRLNDYSKEWIFSYTSPKSKKKRTKSIGHYPHISIAQARQIRDDYKTLVAQGVDIHDHIEQQQTIEQEKQKNTFAYFAELYLQKKELERKRKNLRNDKDENLRKLNKDILPLIGHIPVHELTYNDLHTVFLDYVDRDALHSANRARGIMKAILDEPMRKGLITVNYAVLIKPIDIKVKSHPAITDEKELKQLVKDIYSYIDRPKVQRLTALCLRLALHIFQRSNEIRGLTWDNVNLEKQRLEFKAISKTHQQHIVPLSTQALEIIQQIKALNKNSPYLFPSTRAKSSTISENTLKGALDSLGYDKKQTVHGFRATARTLLEEELGIYPHILERMLAHAVKDPNGMAYNRTQFLADRQKTAQLWSDYLECLLHDRDTSHLKTNNSIYR